MDKANISDRIGEKYLEWSDTSPPLPEILRAVSLYWLTDTLPRAIYPYRGFVNRRITPKKLHGDPNWHIKKPYGFSWFPKEIIPTPRAWAAKSGNLVWHRMHEHVSYCIWIIRCEILKANSIVGWAFCCYGTAGGFGDRC